MRGGTASASEVLRPPSMDIFIIYRRGSAVLASPSGLDPIYRRGLTALASTHERSQVQEQGGLLSLSTATVFPLSSCELIVKNLLRIHNVQSIWLTNSQKY